MLDGELSAREYKEIKLKCEEANEALSRKRANLSSIEDDHIAHLSFTKRLLPNPDIVYEKADLKGKQLIIGSVFPEKLIYEKNQFRTKRVNEVVSYFLLRNKELGYKKSGREDFFSIVHSGRGDRIATHPDYILIINHLPLKLKRRAPFRAHIY